MSQPQRAQAADDLLARCRAGDVEAYTAVYHAFAGTLYGTALRMLASREEAEDVVQDAFVTLFRRAHEVQAGSLLGWLRRVVANACIDRLRARTRWSMRELDDGVLTSPGHSGVATRLDLERAVAALPAGARTVFLLHDVEGFLHHEVAQMLGIAEGASKSQLSRARALLRRRLQGSEEATS